MVAMVLAGAVGGQEEDGVGDPPLPSPSPSSSSSFGVPERVLLRAFEEVFQTRDILLANSRAVVVEEAFRQLDQLGVPRNYTSAGWERDDALMARVLMRAAMGNLMLGLAREPEDWSLVVADVSAGKLVRRRSFSAVRFAVVQSLLLVAILALGRSIWLAHMQQVVAEP